MPKSTGATARVGQGAQRLCPWLAWAATAWRGGTNQPAMAWQGAHGTERSLRTMLRMRYFWYSCRPSCDE